MVPAQSRPARDAGLGLGSICQRREAAAGAFDADLARTKASGRLFSLARKPSQVWLSAVTRRVGLADETIVQSMLHS